MLGHFEGHGVSVREPKGPMRILPDALLIAHITRLYQSAEYPEDRQLELPPQEAALASGFDSTGDRQRELVADAMARITVTKMRHAYVPAKGQPAEWAEWSVLDNILVTKGGVSVATLSEHFAKLLRAEGFVHLNQATFLELGQRDDVGLRLWMMLESQKLTRPWKYLLNGTAKQQSMSRGISFLGDLLRINPALLITERADVLSAAAHAVCEVDPNYDLSVERGAKWGTFTLIVKKTPQPHYRPSPGVDDSEGMSRRKEKGSESRNLASAA
jgi:hypothetical protein